MDRELQRLRKELNRQRGGGPLRPRYPRALREEIVHLAEERQRSGTPITALSTELGLKPSTLLQWMRRRMPKERARRTGFRPVRVIAAPTHPTLVVVLTNGVRVEGLDVSTAIQLLEALR